MPRVLEKKMRVKSTMRQSIPSFDVLGGKMERMLPAHNQKKLFDPSPILKALNGDISMIVVILLDTRVRFESHSIAMQVANEVMAVLPVSKPTPCLGGITSNKGNTNSIPPMSICIMTNRIVATMRT